VKIDQLHTALVVISPRVSKERDDESFANKLLPTAEDQNLCPRAQV